MRTLKEISYPVGWGSSGDASDCRNRTREMYGEPVERQEGDEIVDSVVDRYFLYGLMPNWGFTNYVVVEKEA